MSPSHLQILIGTWVPAPTLATSPSPPAQSGSLTRRVESQGGPFRGASQRAAGRGQAGSGARPSVPPSPGVAAATAPAAFQGASLSSPPPPRTPTAGSAPPPLRALPGGACRSARLWARSGLSAPARTPPRSPDAWKESARRQVKVCPSWGATLGSDPSSRVLPTLSPRIRGLRVEGRRRPLRVPTCCLRLCGVPSRSWVEPLDTRTGWWWRNPSSSRAPGLGTRRRPRSGARSGPWMLRARAPGAGREVPKVRARNGGGLRPAPSQPPGASASPDRPFAPLPGSRGWQRAPARLTWSAAARRREPGGGREAAAAARAGVRGAQRAGSGSCGRPDPPPHLPPPRPLPRAGRSVCFPRPTDVGQNIGHMVAAINWGRAQTLSASMALSAATRPAGGRGRADGGCC